MCAPPASRPVVNYNPFKPAENDNVFIKSMRLRRELELPQLKTPRKRFAKGGGLQPRNAVERLLERLAFGQRSREQFWIGTSEWAIRTRTPHRTCWYRLGKRFSGPWALHAKPIIPLHHWKAIILLNEAYVFVQARSFINPNKHYGNQHPYDCCNAATQ